MFSRFQFYPFAFFLPHDSLHMTISILFLLHRFISAHLILYLSLSLSSVSFLLFSYFRVFFFSYCTRYNYKSGPLKIDLSFSFLLILLLLLLFYGIMQSCSSKRATHQAIFTRLSIKTKNKSPLRFYSVYNDDSILNIKTQTNLIAKRRDKPYEK